MPVLEIEKIYQTKEEIREYNRAARDYQNLRFIENCIWDINFPDILNKVNMKERKIEAWNKLSGFLDDLTPEEWERFHAAIQRRPLFGKSDINED